jgi:hypothetical protein
VQQIFIHNFKSSVGGFGNMVLDTQHVLRHMGELACSKRLDFQSVLVNEAATGLCPNNRTALTAGFSCCTKMA